MLSHTLCEIEAETGGVCMHAYVTCWIPCFAFHKISHSGRFRHSQLFDLRCTFRNIMPYVNGGTCIVYSVLIIHMRQHFAILGILVRMPKIGRVSVCSLHLWFKLNHSIPRTFQRIIPKIRIAFIRVLRMLSLLSRLLHANYFSPPIQFIDFFAYFFDWIGIWQPFIVKSMWTPKHCDPRHWTRTYMHHFIVE